jgi:hypothetical protein
MRMVVVISLLLWAMTSAAQQATSIEELAESIRRGEVYDSHPAQLRVKNVGNEVIEDLTVVFPNGEVEFGDIPMGATTAYEEVSGGVFPYAAYRLKIDGELVTQPVIDWSGARPLEGDRFTYHLELVTPVRPTWPWRLAVARIEVTKD